jgi:hypothetical protein
MLRKNQMREVTIIDTWRAAVAGVAAGTAYLAVMWVDNRLSSHPFNDLKLVGQVFTTRRPWWVVQGVVGHYTFSVAMAVTYARIVYPQLPGPRVIKGIAFLNIENALLYPIAFIADRTHAGVRGGEIPPLLSRKTFLGQVVRHTAFGAVLGILCKPAA